MKIFVKAFLILIITSTLIGYAKENSNKVELEFWTLQLNDFAPYIKDKIATYERNHPNIKIKWVDIPFSEGEKRTLSAVMSKKVPDIINLNPSFSATLQKKNVLAKINANIDNDYIEPALQLCKQNNELYAIPWYVTSKITIYNSELLKNTGYNSPPSNYKEILPFAHIVKRNKNKYAFMPNLAEDGEMLKIMSKQNVSLNEFFISEKTIDTYSLMKKLYKYELIPNGSINQKHRDSLEKYMAGETVFLEAGSNFLKTIKENAPEIYKTTKVAPQLNLENGVTSISLMNFVIPQKSKYKKQAEAFALYMANSRNQAEFCKLAPVLPSTKSALKRPFFLKDTTLIDKGRKISANQLKTAKTTQPIIPNQKQINEIIDYVTQNILLNKKSIKEALNEGSKMMP